MDGPDGGLTASDLRWLDSEFKALRNAIDTHTHGPDEHEHKEFRVLAAFSGGIAMAAFVLTVATRFIHI